MSSTQKPLKVYQYSACSTCKNALKYLQSRSIPFTAIPIVETPPSVAELRKVLAHIKAEGGSLKNLFNTSGAVYKEMGLSRKLPSLPETEALELLHAHGKLIKRPFVVGDGFMAAGFKPDEWARALK